MPTNFHSLRSQFSHFLKGFWVENGSIFPTVPAYFLGFFAVYDGHGGALAAEHCEAELHKVGKCHGNASVNPEGHGSGLVNVP